MAMSNETGNAKNVANFKKLIDFSASYGQEYNPSKQQLKLPALVSTFTTGHTSIQGVIAAETRLDEAINHRRGIFKPLRSYSTRLVNAFAICGAAEEAVEDAKGVNRKMQGVRAVPKPKKKKSESGLPVPDETYISSSQQSYDLQVEHLSRYIEVFNGDGNYSPNEQDISVAAMMALRDAMLAANGLVSQSFVNYQTAIITRDEALYADGTGLTHIALDVKKYVKSVFGARHSKTMQVWKIRFRSPRKD